MKKIITLYDINRINEFSKYADGFIVGSNLFATRLTSSFSIEEINTAIKMVKMLENKEIFLMANQMFTDHALDIFINNLKKIDIDNLTGIIVADIGSLIAIKKIGYQNKVIYNPETLLTNIIDFNFLSSEDIYGAYVAKEITLEDILLIGAKKEHKLFMVAHGHLNMFYSKRKLLDNYKELIKSEVDYTFLQNLKITEPKRKDEPYPILQDSAGTHVFRSHVMNSFSFIKELEKVVDYFVIDTIFKSDDYGYDILRFYNNETILEQEIMEKYQEKWDNGFLNKKTYYKR